MGFIESVRKRISECGATEMEYNEEERIHQEAGEALDTEHKGCEWKCYDSTKSSVCGP